MAERIFPRIPKPEINEEAILAKFEPRKNRTIELPSGEKVIQVFHKGAFYNVQMANSLEDLQAVKKLDDDEFEGQVGISLEELEDIRDHGKVLFLKDNQGNLIAESQVLTKPIKDHENMDDFEVYCYGTAVKKSERKKGYAQVMYKAQEVVAREEMSRYHMVPDPETGGQKEERQILKSRMTLTVRPENAESIRARMHLGYRIVGYDDKRYGPVESGGARFLMEKSLVRESLPFDLTGQIERVKTGTIQQLNEGNKENIFSESPNEVAVPVLTGENVDLTAQKLSQEVLGKGYVGVGLLRPEEYGGRKDESLLIFQKKESVPVMEELTLPLSVTNEYGRLREVIVSWPALSTETFTVINKIQAANRKNMDAIAAVDEHNALIATLEANGVRVVRTSAFPKYNTNEEIDDALEAGDFNIVGRNALFTRDPGMTLGDTLMVGKMGRSIRQVENAGMLRFGEHNKVVDLSDQSSEAVIEGGDVMFLKDNIVLVGLGERTNEAGYQKLVDTYPQYDFVSVPHPELHLDVLFTILGKNKVLADITKLPPEFIEWVKSEGFEVVVADPDEQEPLGCNVLAIDDNKVIAVAENKITNQRMKDAGVEVIEVSMPNIIKKGGGPRCLTCPTKRE